MRPIGIQLYTLRKPFAEDPVGTLERIREVRALYKRLSPDLVHHVALQPSVIGSLAAAGHERLAVAIDARSGDSVEGLKHSAGGLARHGHDLRFGSQPPAPRNHRCWLNFESNPHWLIRFRPQRSNLGLSGG